MKIQKAVVLRLASLTLGAILLAFSLPRLLEFRDGIYTWGHLADGEPEAWFWFLLAFVPFCTGVMLYGAVLLQWLLPKGEGRVKSGLLKMNVALAVFAIALVLMGGMVTRQVWS